MTPFVKLSWEQQKHLFTCSSIIFFLGLLSYRDYLVLFICSCKITFCLGALRNINILQLASERERFKKFIQPKRGFRKKVNGVNY